MRNVLFIILMLGLFSCSNNNNKQTGKPDSDANINSQVDFARWFNVSQHDGFKHLEVINPWDTTSLLGEYLLINDNTRNIPESFKSIQKIQVPIKSMACMSGSHFIMAEKLGIFDNITAVGEAQYVLNQNVLRRIENDSIVSIQHNGIIDAEQALNVSPDVIFASPYENSDYSNLENMGLTVVSFADYMEKEPLGRAEWIRFMALFFQKEDQADSILNRIKFDYQEVKERVINTEYKPSLLSDKPFRGIWYLPGGDSYMARIFNDAGADYLWKDEKESGSLALDFEVVYNRGAEADFWRLFITTPGPFSYQNLLEIDERFEDFKAFKDKKVIICKTVESRYFEKAGMEPEKVLADLAYIFHPEVFETHIPVYFTVLK